ATEATVNANASELVVALVERETCSVHTVESIGTTARRHRSVSKPVVALEYVFGTLLAATGAFALADPTDTRTVTQTHLDDNTMLGAGATAAAIGGLLLITGIVDSTRGGDSSQVMPSVERTLGDAHEV